MGISGGGKTVSGSAQKWAAPIATAAANTATGIFNANQPNLNAITSQVQGLLPGLQTKYNNGNPALNSAQGYAKDVLGGKYLGQGNPYLNSMIDATNRSVTNQVGAAYGSRGSFGGTAWQQGLAGQLAEAQNALRYGDYSQERQNQQQAMSAAPQMAAADYLGIQPLLQTATTAAALPYTGLEAYTGALGTLMNGSATKAPGIGSSILGGLASGAGMALASDIRVKKDIAKVGELEDGLGVYDFRYVWEDDTPLHRGVMAQEVEKLRPWALGPTFGDGYMTVDYSKLEAR